MMLPNLWLRMVWQLVDAGTKLNNAVSSVLLF